MCARKIFLHARKKLFCKNICEKILWKSRVFQESQKRKKERGKIAPRFYAVQTEQKYLFLSVFEILKFWNRGKNFWFSCFFIFKNIFKMQKWCKSLIGLLACWKKVRFCARVLKRMCTQCFFVKIEKWAIPASEPFEVKINYFKLFLAFLKNGALF